MLKRHTDSLVQKNKESKTIWENSKMWMISFKLLISERVVVVKCISLKI